MEGGEHIPTIPVLKRILAEPDEDPSASSQRCQSSSAADTSPLALGTVVLPD